MKIIDTQINGLKILVPNVFEDKRGKFVKTFNDTFFQEHDLNIEIKETYYSLSNKNVIRGMHFQSPPDDHIKLVYVPHGKILDVVLDIRKDSLTYGKYFSIELSSENSKILIIPKGLAHGFKSLADDTNVTYMQTTTYSPNCDHGIRFDSFGFNWKVQDPELSERDIAFETFTKFQTPFIVEKK